MKKVLFIANHRKGRSPGQRFRFEQYLDFLSQNGFQCDLSYIISEKDDTVFYRHGKYINKACFLFKSLYKRFQDTLQAKNYDIIFIFREAHVLGTAFYERLFARTKTKIIYDFDDAIWLSDVSQGNKNLAWLKNPSKTAKIIRLSDCVFAGNNFLADYARQFNANVKVVPTTIDTDLSSRQSYHKYTDKICIGWTGTSTTLKYFELALPFLIKLRQKYPDEIYFKMISDKPLFYAELNTVCRIWNKNTEIQDLLEIDIGIMPLPDNEWSKGKCGFKGLQYMSLEIPAVMSDVGVNKEIITDGENGFLAKTDEEWFAKLSLLIESKALREKLGKNGRKTVVERYSVISQQHKYLEYFNELCNHNSC